MNALIHSEFSVKRLKGRTEDYYDLHDFADSSKEVCSTQQHRLYFHTLWGVKRVIIPIFGHTIRNSDGISVNIKDLMEIDHIIPDMKCIPTLSDFIDLMSARQDDGQRLSQFRKENSQLFQSSAVAELLDSPAYQTGKECSLFITYNSWFVGTILPRVFPETAALINRNFSLAPKDLFSRIPYRPWMSGKNLPPSVQTPEIVLPQPIYPPLDKYPKPSRPPKNPKPPYPWPGKPWEIDPPRDPWHPDQVID